MGSENPTFNRRQVLKAGVVFALFPRELRAEGDSDRELRAQRLTAFLSSVENSLDEPQDLVLSPNDLTDIVWAAGDELLKQQDRINAKLKNLEVGITDTIGSLKGKAEIKKGPLSPDIGFSGDVVPGDTPESLKVTNLKLQGNRAVVEGVQVLDGVYNPYLNDLNMAAKRALNDLLVNRAIIESVGLRIEENNLVMSIQGKRTAQ